MKNENGTGCPVPFRVRGGGFSSRVFPVSGYIAMWETGSLQSLYPVLPPMARAWKV